MYFHFYTMDNLIIFIIIYVMVTYIFIKILFLRVVEAIAIFSSAFFLYTT